MGGDGIGPFAAASTISTDLQASVAQEAYGLLSSGKPRVAGNDRTQSAARRVIYGLDYDTGEYRD